MVSPNGPNGWRLRSRHFRLVLGLLILGLALPAALPAETALRFSLEQTRTGERLGPFELRDGAAITLGERAYRLRRAADRRVSFQELGSGEVYGPFELVAGRIIEVGPAFYTVADLIRVEAGQAPPARLPPSVSAPPPPPPPIISAVDAASSPAVRPVAPPRPLLPEVDPGLRLSGWFALWQSTPLDWKVGDRSGREAALERVGLGVSSLWDGWTTEASVAADVHSGDLVPTGLEYGGASLEEGSGWRLSGGYQRPFRRDGSWEVVGGVRLAYAHMQADLVSSVLAPGSVATNQTQELVYVSRRESVSVDEWSAWIDVGATYRVGAWRLQGGLSVVPWNALTVDGDLAAANGTPMSLDASRTTPLVGTVGASYAIARWRLFGELATGAEGLFRCGVTHVF